MAQTLGTAPGSDILHDSSKLIEVLKQRLSEAPDPTVDEALVRHQALHNEMELRHALGEQTLEAWRTALIHRWRCEIAGQRLYRRIQRQLCDHFGEESPHLRAIAPMHGTNGITPEELLAELGRTHATLLLIESIPSDLAASVEELGSVCEELATSLRLASELQMKRRYASLEEQHVHDMYQRVRHQTYFLLHEGEGAGVMLERTTRTEAHVGVA